MIAKFVLFIFFFLCNVYSGINDSFEVVDTRTGDPMLKLEKCEMFSMLNKFHHL